MSRFRTPRAFKSKMSENAHPNEQMSLNQTEKKLMEHKGGKTIAAKAELRPNRELKGLAGDLNKRLEVSRNIWRRKLVSPFLIAGGLKFALCNDPVDKEASNTINQQSNDTQLGNNRRAAKRSNGRFALVLWAEVSWEVPDNLEFSESPAASLLRTRLSSFRHSGGKRASQKTKDKPLTIRAKKEI
jgi:hypothetical protein